MRTKSLFEIAVPVAKNDGTTVPEGSHLAFENMLLEHAGGYTRMPDTDGAWRSDDGRIFYDRMRAYRVVCGTATIQILLEYAFKIYNDQIAIFVSEIGRAWIVPAGCSSNQLDRYLIGAGSLAKQENTK